jgi:hypothetical protein
LVSPTGSPDRVMPVPPTPSPYPFSRGGPHLFAPGVGNFCIYFFDKKFGLFGLGGLTLPCPHITRSPYVCHIPFLYILIFGYVSHTCSSVCHTWFPYSFTLLVNFSLPYPFSRTRSSYVITFCFPYVLIFLHTVFK